MILVGYLPWAYRSHDRSEAVIDQVEPRARVDTPVRLSPAHHALRARERDFDPRPHADGGGVDSEFPPPAHSCPRRVAASDTWAS